MASLENVLEWRGMDVIDSDGDKIGSIEEIYVDQETDRPEWALLNMGLFGGNSTFLPISGASADRGQVRVPFDKGHVKDAPIVDAGGELTQDQEAQLYRHYGVDYGESRSSSRLPEGDRGDEHAPVDRGDRDPDLRDRAQRRGADPDDRGSRLDRPQTEPRGAGGDTRDRDSGVAPAAPASSKSRSAGGPRVADERPSSQRPRLRRYVVTEVETASGTQEVEREQVAETELGEEQQPRR